MTTEGGKEGRKADVYILGILPNKTAPGGNSIRPSMATQCRNPTYHDHRIYYLTFIVGNDDAEEFF